MQTASASPEAWSSVSACLVQGVNVVWEAGGVRLEGQEGGGNMSWEGQNMRGLAVTLSALGSQ